MVGNHMRMYAYACECLCARVCTTTSAVRTTTSGARASSSAVHKSKRKNTQLHEEHTQVSGVMCWLFTKSVTGIYYLMYDHIVG